jgi:hypothetical protein
MRSIRLCRMHTERKRVLDDSRIEQHRLEKELNENGKHIDKVDIEGGSEVEQDFAMEQC